MQQRPLESLGEGALPTLGSVVQNFHSSGWSPTAQAPGRIPGSTHLSLRPPWAILVTLSEPDFSTSWEAEGGAPVSPPGALTVAPGLPQKASQDSGPLKL